MQIDPLCRLTAAAGLAALVAGRAEAGLPPVVTMPLNETTYSADSSGGYQNCPPGYAGHAYGAGSYGWPQYGYTPPAKYPVERIPVQYLRYYPAAWYGLPGSTLPVVAPQVYMPTDTTQQGYYYQRVPTWQPVPGMLPPAPNPALFHQYVPMGNSGTGASYPSGMGNYSGMQNYETVSTEASGMSAVSDRTVIDTPTVRPTPPLPTPNAPHELPLTPPSITPPVPPTPEAFVPPAAPAAS